MTSVLLQSLLILTISLITFRSNSSAAEAGPVTVGFLNPRSLQFEIDKVDSYESVFVIKQIAQTLLEQNPSGKNISSVAKFWTISKDLKTYTFFLRDNVLFHDGSKLTAEDVKYSLNIVKSSTVNPLNIYLRRIKAISIIDPYTVQIELTTPWFGFLHCLASGLVPIFSAEAHASNGTFISSGPYRLKIEGGAWHFERFEHYVGPYRPIESRFKILTVDAQKSGVQPDILIKDLAIFPTFSGYEKVDVDSFTAFNFMINPERAEWEEESQRLMLLKALMEAKEIVKTSRLLDLKDIFPKGMLGYDIKHKGYDLLMEKIEHVDPSTLKKRVIKIGSLGEIFNFHKLAETIAAKYGIKIENTIVVPPNYLEKLRNNKEIDVYTVGWASIFTHPDATFVPFYILGLKNFGASLANRIERINQARTLSSQYAQYRQLSYEAISNGYILPHSQVGAEMYVKSSIVAPKFRYRYTMQLAEVKRRMRP